MNKLTPIKFIPIWLISRRRYFTLVTLDAIIIFLIFIKEIGILNINLPKFIFFETFWILLSYSLGRYSTNKINLVEIFKPQIKKSFIFTLSTNFILRNGFWAPGINKLQARKDYIKNIEDNLFTFCYRGAGILVIVFMIQ